MLDLINRLEQQLEDNMDMDLHLILIIMVVGLVQNRIRIVIPNKIKTIIINNRILKVIQITTNKVNNKQHIFLITIFRIKMTNNYTVMVKYKYRTFQLAPAHK
jgi:hypothetical protein